MKTKAMDKKKLKALHEAQEQEILEMLERKICPYRKCPCEQMVEGQLVINRKKFQKKS